MTTTGYSGRTHDMAQGGGRARARARTNPLETSVLQFQPDNNNYYYTRAREDITCDVMQELGEIYADVLGRDMPRFVARYLHQCMEHGAQADLLGAILEYTGGAPRPSWAYARAVIDRQMMRGARTASDFWHGVDEYRSQQATKREARADPATQYTQRAFLAGQYDGLSPQQLEALGLCEPREPIRHGGKTSG